MGAIQTSKKVGYLTILIGTTMGGALLGVLINLFVSIVTWDLDMNLTIIKALTMVGFGCGVIGCYEKVKGKAWI